MSPCSAKISALRNKHASKSVYTLFLQPHIALATLLTD